MTTKNDYFSIYLPSYSIDAKKFEELLKKYKLDYEVQDEDYILVYVENIVNFSNFISEIKNF